MRMGLFRWIIRILKGIRDRLLWIGTGIFGPPLAALRRVVLRAKELFDAAVAKILEAWANLWRGAPKDDETDLGKPSIACALLAAGFLGLALYTWPSRQYLHPVSFGLVSTAAWFIALRRLQSMSLPDSESPFRDLLRQAGERTGLLWWERGGLLLSLVLLVFAFASPWLLPLALSLAYGFLRLLFTEYTLRELKLLREAPLEPPPDPESEDGYVIRHFEWVLNTALIDDPHVVSLPLHIATYERLKATQPKFLWDGPKPRFDKWVTGGSTIEVDRASHALNEIAHERDYSTFAQISNVLAFVQGIEYTLDIDSAGEEEYWRYPIETLYDETGDCEDTTILAAAILRRLGHRVGMIDAPGHAALAVEAPAGTPGEFFEVKGLRMYYCETTGEGWAVGEVPKHLRGAKMKVHMVEPS